MEKNRSNRRGAVILVGIAAMSSSFSLLMINEPGPSIFPEISVFLFLMSAVVIGSIASIAGSSPDESRGPRFRIPVPFLATIQERVFEGVTARDVRIVAIKSAIGALITGTIIRLINSAL